VAALALGLGVCAGASPGCHTRGGLVLSLETGTAGSAPDGGLGGAGEAGTGADSSGLGAAGGSAGTGAGAGGVGGAPVTDMTTYYIGPDGSDGNPGTSPTAPFRTFPHALSLLLPGSTLVLLDGTYTPATTGLLQVFCSGPNANASSGTTAAPITVRAMNERQAFILGDGRGLAPILLSACANWVVEGLHAEENDVPGQTGIEAGSVVVVVQSTNIVLRRLLAAHPNRYLWASVYVIAHDVVNVLAEECEALAFHYYGFHAYDVQHMTFRRSYAHSRDTPDIPGGQVTNPTTRGDGGFLLEKSSNAIAENCVAEDVADGFIILGHSADGGKVQPQRDWLLGDMALGITHAGYVLQSLCDPTMKPCNQGDEIVSSSRLSNVVSSGGRLGLSFQGGVDNTVTNASVFDASDTGVSFSLDPDNAAAALLSNASARATLVTCPLAAIGFHSTGQNYWTFTQVNSFGPAMSFVPRDSHLMMGTSVDPQLGGCLVVVPDASPFKAAGLGANIVFQTVGGQPTTTKLWDQTTGQFPCGAVVPGLNDAALSDLSCIGVGTRLHVGAMGCPIP
jgi:hypothetical protein